MELDSFSGCINKYMNLKAPGHHEFLSCLDLICQELAAYAKTKVAVEGSTRKETDPGILRAYSISNFSYLNRIHESSGDNKKLAQKRAQRLGTSYYGWSSNGPESVIWFIFLLDNCEQVNTPPYQTGRVALIHYDETHGSVATA